ncbi:phenylacetic acid degradation bifunctional protein PaaZ [Marinicella sp. S1101]|uniref:phenylacetic acid degradation bifunctional protein PaaZ n=1 Tax=Marinicella marina TaxID=2996016 RepID=UPI002260C194|nr:phenylacetic acid degradation bifunctional protein PaaZ [Marinicella marina]MCX7552430.1 phenylacetic acid degradation bifunctional protein PaaZ [Marinicella marina]MDJ1139305.1 phenylacetic acid degradation bifunctional protein PaaZ [Marinicella marina]
MNQLKSYAKGQWHTAKEGFKTCNHAINGQAIAQISSAGLDFSGMLDYAKTTGQAALAKMTFHERALMLKELALYLTSRKKEFYQLSAATGATKLDSWIDIDGGIGTLFVYSGKGRREMPDHHILLDGPPEHISKNGTFLAQHICTSLQGVAIHINAFNFPCWGMLEKLAPSLLGGVPAIVKPASDTAYLTELMFQAMIDSGVLPEGSVQLICGSTGNLLDLLTCQDVVAFTGSAATGQYLKSRDNITKNAVRFTMEADSLNCSILTPDATPDTPEFDLYVKEVVREMTVKAGQKCTAIRRAIVPAELTDAVAQAISKELAEVTIGDPTIEGVKMGSLASMAQQQEVRERVAELQQSCELIYGDPNQVAVTGANDEAGAFVSPILLLNKQPLVHHQAHDIEAFGPVSTLMPYDTLAEAGQLANLGQGSLVGSIFGQDDDAVCELVNRTAAFHGRLMLINRDSAGESSGHGSPLPHLVHGGPGRAGGGEEMGGIRGVKHYMQRTAIQGSPTTLTKLTAKYMPKAATIEPPTHPFKLHYEELAVGQAITTASREITLGDIEAFADLSGDHFYAHMDEDAAARNPFFDGRVAHGYFLVSMAAGLFVYPDEGPVLANYGLDDLRFTEPVYPGDVITIQLTCKQKSYRRGKGYGEVRWDLQAINQHDEVVAAYDILTMVASNSEPFAE